MNSYFILFLFLLAGALNAQYTKNDTLRGTNTIYRNFWDVKKYDITVQPNFETKEIKGNNTITFEIEDNIENPTFQIDLQQPMEFRISNTSFPIKTIHREDSFIFIQTDTKFKKGYKGSISIDYWGKPTQAKNAPWDGGWVFILDEFNKPFASVAQQNIGTSVWLPVKDTWQDEADNGIKMSLITPQDIIGVGNGKLINKETKHDKIIYTWEVKNPINTYSIVPNFGNYKQIKDKYKGENGILELEYWVLNQNEEKASNHFKQIPNMLKILEYWLGPYPFYKDHYKVVETPYLGMEHQSNIAYGNQFKNGYLGKDLSGTGVGLKWDFILVHETAHEWFANNITAKDQAEMWIHEAFTSYSETLFIDQFINKTAANQYLIGTRSLIENKKPIIGDFGVRYTGDSDMYYKGASMIHTIRNIINDDELFRNILRGLNTEFKHQIVDSNQIIAYINSKSGIDFTSVFYQYLKTTLIPVLEYQQKGNELKFRYHKIVDNLHLPLRINSRRTITPKSTWQTLILEDNEIVSLDENYYIEYIKTNPN